MPIIIIIIITIDGRLKYFGIGHHDYKALILSLGGGGGEAGGRK